MSTLDDDVRALTAHLESAREVTGDDWWTEGELYGNCVVHGGDFIEACSPARIARVLAELERLRAENTLLRQAGGVALEALDACDESLYTSDGLQDKIDKGLTALRVGMGALAGAATS